jgi:hypothetical protein
MKKKRETKKARKIAVISKVFGKGDDAQVVNAVLTELMDRAGDEAVELSVLPCGETAVVFCVHCDSMAKRGIKVSKVFDIGAPAAEVQQILDELLGNVRRNEQIVDVDYLACGDRTGVFVVYLERN